jgi:hypothetical protein
VIDEHNATLLRNADGVWRDFYQASITLFAVSQGLLGTLLLIHGVDRAILSHGIFRAASLVKP